jgi:nucleotide-binding universal stress UspA family protein
MTIVVGYPANRRGKAVISLAAMLARSSGEDLVVCAIIPAPWTPGLSRADEGYRSYIDEVAGGALAQARAELGPDVPAQFTTIDARSVPSGLLHAAEEHQASMIAVGSSKGGHFGQITLSSVADRLLHSSPVPVALAARGFRPGPSNKLQRVTVAYTGTGEGEVLLRAAVVLAHRFGATIRLASFAVQHAPPETAFFRAETAGVIAEWTASIQAAAHKDLEADPEARQTIGESPEVVIGHGHDWEDALNDVEWRDGDLLMIGSSESGPIARVFLGSRAAKIVRHSPVPVLIVPRGAAKELSEE